MGQRARLTAWPARIAFAAMIVVAAVLRLDGAPDAQAGQESLLVPARTVLTAAGYSVDPLRRRSFLGGVIKTDYFLDARHPGCAAGVTVRVMRIADKPEPPPPGAVAPLFVFGSWTGAHESRPRILLEAARLQALATLRLGRGVRPVPALLIVTDPSACLAIATPEWGRIWVG